MPVVNYLWDPDEDNIVKEFDDAGNTIADYTTEPFLYGDVISQRRSGVSHFYHFDTQGNTTELIDINGNTTDIRRYSAFGETTESTGTTTFPFQYVGKKGYCLNSLTGQYQMRRRVYEPLQARWLSADPDGIRVASLDGAYIYAHNSPCNWTDGSGLSPNDCALAVPGICETVDAQEALFVPDGAKCHAALCDGHGYPGYECFEQRSKLWCVKCGCTLDSTAPVGDPCCTRGGPPGSHCKPVRGIVPLIGPPGCDCVDVILA